MSKTEAAPNAASEPAAPSRSALSKAARSSSFEKVCKPSAPKSWWLERSSVFRSVVFASSTVAKPRPAPPPPRVTSRVESALASSEARHRGDARTVAVVRRGAPRRTRLRSMINFAVVSSKFFAKFTVARAARPEIVVQRTRDIYMLLLTIPFYELAKLGKKQSVLC